MSEYQRTMFLLIGNFFRLSTAVATIAVFWLYIMRQETCCIAWWMTKAQYLTIFFNVYPGLFEYLGTPILEYREYWVMESQNLVCYVSGTLPFAARGTQNRAQQQQRKMSYLQSLLPRLLVKKGQPIYALVWKSDSVQGDILRIVIIYCRAFVYIWSTIVLSSLVLLPTRQAVAWFMGAVGLLLYNSVVLLILDLLPGNMIPIAEATVR
jgi:hypothetical protein